MVIFFVVATLGFQTAWRYGRRRSSSQILDGVRRWRSRCEILNRNRTFRHGLLWQEISASRNEIIGRQTALAQELRQRRWWNGWLLVMLRKRRNRRVMIGRNWRRKRVDRWIGRIGSRQWNHRRSTKRNRLWWWPVRRRRPKSRRVHDRSHLTVLWLSIRWLSVRWMSVMRLSYRRRQSDWRISRCVMIRKLLLLL